MNAVSLQFILMSVLLQCIGVRGALADDISCTSPLKLGVILPLSGDLSVAGAAIRNGVSLAAEKLLPGCKTEIIYEDDAMQQVKSVASFHKLVDTDHVQALLVFSSGSGKAIAPLADAKKIPVIAIASDAAVSRGRAYSFNHWVTPEAEVAIIIPEAVKRGYKAIAIISSEQDGAIAAHDAFISMSAGRFHAPLNERYSLGERDFRAFIAKAKRVPGLDAILVNLLPGQIGLFAKQAREGGVKVPFFGFENFEDEHEISVAQGNLTGAWYATSGEPSSQFLTEYQARFPGAPYITAANGYDGLMLLTEGIAASSDPTEAAEYLRKVKDFSGALGTYSAAGDNRFMLPATLKEVTREGFKELY